MKQISPNKIISIMQRIKIFKFEIIVHILKMVLSLKKLNKWNELYMAYKNQHSTYLGTLHFICTYLKIKSLPKDKSAYIGKGYVHMHRVHWKWHVLKSRKVTIRNSLMLYLTY